MNARRALQIAAAGAATIVVGYFVLRQLDWQEVLRLWSSANLWLLGAAFVTYVSANVLRALRFRALTGDRIGSVRLFRAVLLQNFLNTFLPFRAGELSYLYMVHRTGLVKVGENLGSLLGARVLDLVSALMIPLLTLPLSTAWSAPGQAFAWFVGLACLAAAGLAVGIWRAIPLADWMAALAQGKGRRLNRVLLTVSDMLRALGQLRQGRLLGRVMFLTGGCWVLIYLCGYMSLIGLRIEVGFWDGLFAYSFPMIASMTPFYMLGGFGVFEGSVGVGLNQVGVPLSTAMAAGVVLHVAELLFVTLPVPLLWMLRDRTPKTLG